MQHQICIPIYKYSKQFKALLAGTHTGQTVISAFITFIIAIAAVCSIYAAGNRLSGTQPETNSGNYDSGETKGGNIDKSKQRRVTEDEVKHIPGLYKYKDVNTDKLKAFLNSRNSVLAGEPYLKTIVNTAWEYDLNPLLLFAVIGQEQSFVPAGSVYASKIANNPFNVYRSWKEYNTDIIDSSRIASRTIINASKNRPVDTDFLQWVNRTYSEDKNWWKGVKEIFIMLEKKAGYK